MCSNEREKIRVELASRLELIGVKYFTADELLFLGGRHYLGKAKGLNHLPSVDLLDNLASVALIADEIRKETDTALGVISAFRSRAYNAAIGGAIHSKHLAGMALDLAPSSGVDDKIRKVAEIVVGDRGGLGIYRTFIHVDCRGHRARW